MTPLEFDKALAEQLGSMFDKPYEWVMFSFPWGVKGGPLEHRDGPDIWQETLLRELGKHISANMFRKDNGIDMEAWWSAVSSGHGVGKATDIQLMLDTPTGYRRWGDLQVGDEVFGRDGKPTKIVAVHPQGVMPTYRVTFDDGASTVVTAEHVGTGKGRNARRTGAGWRDMPTAEIMAEGVQRPNGVASARQWELPLHDAVEYPAQNVPVDPYVLGVWLGDGGRMTARITSEDLEVMRRLEEKCGAVGCHSKDGSQAFSVGLRGVECHLRDLGVLSSYSYQKFVPKLYRENSSEVRAEVLRGLLDTDGECQKNGCIIFSSTSLELATDVVWLARSLGGKARISAAIKHPTYTHKGEKLTGRDCFRATLQMPKGFQSFYVSRKQERVKDVEDRYRSRWIESIEPEGEAECQCITVAAADGLYLTEDFIVTHNSALVSWIILFLMSTRVDCRGVVTANTESQLQSKTWPELSKWHGMFIAKHWFKWTSTQFYYALYPEDRRKNYCVDAIPWSEDRTEGFAGLHNESSAIFMIFDEASAIPKLLYEVAEGAMTDVEPFWFCFGNPTRSDGRFFDCFNKFRKWWKTWTVDSRQVKITNKLSIAKLVEQYGEDSDQVRVRVRGQFPKGSLNGYITYDEVEAAQTRELPPINNDGLIMAVDVARFGDDQSIIRFRRGVDARSIPPLRFQGLDTQQLAAKVVDANNKFEPDLIVVEGSGVGGGVVDACRLLGLKIVEINPGRVANDKKDYFNVRAEMHGLCKEWLRKHGCIDPDDQALAGDLTKVEYRYNDKNQLILESKKDMKDRGLASPDDGDAHCLTFTVKVPKRTSPARRGAQVNRGPAKGVDYELSD